MRRPLSSHLSGIGCVVCIGGALLSSLGDPAVGDMWFHLHLEQVGVQPWLQAVGDLWCHLHVGQPWGLRIHLSGMCGVICSWGGSVSSPGGPHVGDIWCISIRPLSSLEGPAVEDVLCHLHLELAAVQHLASSCRGYVVSFAVGAGQWVHLSGIFGVISLHLFYCLSGFVRYICLSVALWCHLHLEEQE